MARNQADYRQQLLAEARASMASGTAQTGRRGTYPVHSRYMGRTEPNEGEGQIQPINSFKVRCVAAVVLFLGVLYLYMSGSSVYGYDYEKIADTLSSTIEVEDVSAYIENIEGQLFPEG